VKRWLAVLGVLTLLLSTGGVLLQQRAEAQRARDRREALAVGTKFLRAWPAKRYAEMGAVTRDDPGAGDSFRNLEARLQATTVRVTSGSLSTDGRSLPFHVTVALQGLGELSWDNQLQLTKSRGGWRVQFRSATVYPGLQNGQVLRRSAPLTSRGELVDRDGRTIRTASRDLALNVLGSRGSTKTGLERIYDTQLTGTSGGRVEVVDRASGTVVRVVRVFPPHPARPVRTTLDLRTQKAAEAALASVSGRAALVVVDTLTGEIRAVANTPVAGVPAAFRDEAPGSTFKVVVAAAALMHGYRPTTQVECPESVVFGGKEFRIDEPLPARMSLAQAFAVSCNTAFLNVADTFPKGTLRTTSRMFGFGRGPLLPTGAQGGEVPPPSSTSEAYADVIGQGRVEASPLLLASMSAAVASGAWRQPHLVPGHTTSAALPAAIVAPLQQMMAGVVTRGTARTAGLPAGTHGKTGTAQYGSGSPLPTHAWFTGYRGRLAFCVYLENGESGGRSAAPIAAQLLRSLPS
jgi:cell division protein FtsI/penicillin-binding protein 2